MLQALLRKLFKYKKFDADKWWTKQRDKYRAAWDEFAVDNKALAITEAKDEYEYRTNELNQLSTRTNMLVTMGGIVLAACVFFFQGGSTVVVVLSKLSACATGTAMILALRAYMTKFKALIDDFMPAEVWVGLIKEPFDVYVKHVLRTQRKTKPLDRYKRLHAIAVPSLATGIALIIVAFIFR